jgi:hypothetical protein
MNMEVKLSNILSSLKESKLSDARKRKLWTVLERNNTRRDNATTSNLVENTFKTRSSSLQHNSKGGVSADVDAVAHDHFSFVGHAIFTPRRFLVEIPDLPLCVSV